VLADDAIDCFVAQALPQQIAVLTAAYGWHGLEVGVAWLDGVILEEQVLRC
jgi:hypothetical protein